MKTLLCLLPTVWMSAASVASADDRPANTTTVVAQSPDAPALTYDTAERIQAMPLCRGTVAEKFSCCVLMSAEDGTNFWIGSPAGTSEVSDFIATLAKGVSYTFPDAFLAWKQKDAQPAAAITAPSPGQPVAWRLVARAATLHPKMKAP